MPPRGSTRPSGRPRQVQTGCADGQIQERLHSPKGMFYETILTRMITDDRKGSFRLERIAKRRKRRVEPGQLVVHGDADRLEESGEIVRPGARTEHGANRVHEVVAHGERRALPASHDLGRQTRGAALITVLEEPGAKLVGGRRIEQVGRGRSRFLPSAYSAGRPAGT